MSIFKYAGASISAAKLYREVAELQAEVAKLQNENLRLQMALLKIQRPSVECGDCEADRPFIAVIEDEDINTPDELRVRLRMTKSVTPHDLEAAITSLVAMKRAVKTLNQP